MMNFFKDPLPIENTRLSTASPDKRDDILEETHPKCDEVDKMSTMIREE